MSESKSMSPTDGSSSSGSEAEGEAEAGGVGDRGNTGWGAEAGCGIPMMSKNKCHRLI